MDHPYIAPPSGGLLGQFAALANSGLQAWDQNRKFQLQQDLANKQTEEGLMSKGLMTDTNPDSPTYKKAIRNPVAEAQYQTQLKESDPTTAESKMQVALTKQMLSHAGLTDVANQMDPEKTSGQQARMYQEQFKPFISGQYQVQSKQPTVQMANERLNASNSKSAQGAINNDKIINTYVPRLDGAQKILSLINGAEKGDFKSNQALLGQLNAEIARLETGSQSPGLGQSEKTEMEDSAAKLHNVLDTLSGNVTGVDLSKKFEQAKGMVNDLGRSYYGQINNRMGSLKAGSLPSQQSVFDQKADYFQKNYPSFASGNESGGLIPPGMASRPGSQTGSPAQAAPSQQNAPLSFEEFKKLKRAGKL